MLRLLDMEQWFSLISQREQSRSAVVSNVTLKLQFLLYGGGRCLCLPIVLAIRVLLEVLQGVSTVQHWTPFFVNIKEVLMIVPVVYATVGSCGVALLRRSGGLLQVCWERREV